MEAGNRKETMKTQEILDGVVKELKKEEKRESYRDRSINSSVKVYRGNKRKTEGKEESKKFMRVPYLNKGPKRMRVNQKVSSVMSRTVFK